MNITPFEQATGDALDELPPIEHSGLAIESPDGLDPFDEDAQPATLKPVRTEGEDLIVSLLLSPYPAATITKKEGAAAREVDGIEAVLFSEDLGRDKNRFLPWRPDEPILAEDEVLYCGQPIAIIVGHSEAACREARDKVSVQFHKAPGILSIDHAMAMKSFHGEPCSISRGDPEAVFQKVGAEDVLEGAFSISSQLPGGRPPGVRINFRPGERGLTVEVRTESPGHVRSSVASVFGLPESEISVAPLPLENAGTACEIESALISTIAAIAAERCRWSVGLKLDEVSSALLLGRRHEASSAFKVAHDEEGRILAVDLRLVMNGGYSVGDSETVLDRAMLHVDSAYSVPDFSVTGQLCKSSVASCPNLPAEGTAQGTWIMEEIVSRLANKLGIPVETVRERNFYREEGGQNSTHYGQPVNAKSIARVWTQARRRSAFDERRKLLKKWNRKNAAFKRGIGLVPMKVGVGDPRSDQNRGSAQVQILGDGSIRVHPGFVDVFDGLTDQVQHNVAVSFGVSIGQVSVFPGNPETNPHMTSRLGTDATGLTLRAVEHACETLKERLRTVALQMLASRGKGEIELEAIQFSASQVGVGGGEKSRNLDFPEVIEGALRRRVNLMANGFFRTPNLWWDREVGAGWPFSGFAYGAAVVEVQIDAFTGEIDVMRVDLVHEGSPAPEQSDRDEAQFMQSFARGQGWLLSEPAGDVENDDPIEILTTGAEGIPGLSDAPIQIEIDRLRPLGDPASLPGAPCAEAPLVLAIGVRDAVRDAIYSFAHGKPVEINLPIPSTPPEVLTTLRDVSAQLAALSKSEKEEAETQDGTNSRKPA